MTTSESFCENFKANYYWLTSYIPAHIKSQLENFEIILGLLGILIVFYLIDKDKIIEKIKEQPSSSLKFYNHWWIYSWYLLTGLLLFSLAFSEIRLVTGIIYFILTTIYLWNMGGQISDIVSGPIQKIDAKIKFSAPNKIEAQMMDLIRELSYLNEDGHKYLVSEQLTPFLEDFRELEGMKLIKELSALLVSLKKDAKVFPSYTETPGPLNAAFMICIETLENELSNLTDLRKKLILDMDNLKT